MGWPAETSPDAARQLFALDGRIALVTGASRGLGLEMAAGVASAGAHVLLNSRDPAKAEALVAEFAAAGLSADPLAFDPADDAATQNAIEQVAKRHGRLDILIGNAAMRHRAQFSAITPADFRHVLDANLTAAFALCRAAMPLLEASRRGRIVLVSSIGAQTAPFGDAAYVASKAGLEALMRAIAVEYAGKGINCNAISPGSFLTEINREMAAAAGDFFRERVPLGRLGWPREIAGAAIFLASDAASFLTGHVLVVDGGKTIAF